MATPLINTNNVPNERQFSIRQSGQQFQTPARRVFEPVARSRPSNLGTGGTVASNTAGALGAITSVEAMNPFLHVTPGSTTNLIYTMPTAASLFQEFGRNLDTGLSNVAVGDCLTYRVLNDSTTGATFSPFTTSANALSTVTCAPGKLTTLCLEVTQVGSSLNGMTGDYKLFTN